MSDLKLQKLIESLEVASDVRNMDETNPIVHRLSNPTIRKVTAIVCGVREPMNLILPLNVTWFVFDPLSPYYKMALRRKSKTTVANSGFVHQWELVDTIDQVFVDQFYDAEDTALLNENEPVPAATTLVPGIARLSYPAKDATDPIVVSETDPRLTDARTPKAHSHPEKPATKLKTKTGVVTIDQSKPPVVGATLVATSPTSAEWRVLTSSDIQR